MSPWKKFTYKIRNYTWRERLLLLLGLVLLVAGIGLVVAHFTGGNDAAGGDRSFVISSSDQCQAVANGNAIPGEDSYPVLRLNWIIDVSTYTDWTEVEALTAEVKFMFQALVLPTLVGCVDEPNDDEARAQKYKVLNGFFRNARDAGDCGMGQRRPCARIYVNVALWMRQVGTVALVDAFLAHLLTEFG